MIRMARSCGFWRAAALAVAVLSGPALAVDVLRTTDFSNCNSDTGIQVQKVDLTYDNDQKLIEFDITATSTKVQNVTAVLDVTVYGQSVYSNSFNPCDTDTFVEQLCPIPEGQFQATGTQTIPSKYADMVPSIAFQIPDIAAEATMQLKAVDSGNSVACIHSGVTNGKTANVPAVSYIAAAVAGVALLATAVVSAGAVAAGGGAASAGAGTVSPSFFETFTWFQGIAMNGMLSVEYPAVYRSFSKNFGFSVGLIPWTDMQKSIDNFRAATGGNVTNNNVDYLRNVTLVYSDGSAVNGSSSTNGTVAMLKRAVGHVAWLATREEGGSAEQTVRETVKGIEAYVEQLAIPSANTFMTVLLVVCIVIAAIAVGILLVKVVLEMWGLWGNFPPSLKGFREHYWGSIARTITSLILLLYGVWVLYCIFQFTHGDGSWAAKLLAAISLLLFTGVLAFFSFKIWRTARTLQQSDGDASRLYQDKSLWVRYRLFYDAYRKDYWWIFVPTIAYMFVKGCCLAATDGHGMAQTLIQLFIEAIMLCLLVWSRPYERKSGNVINIAIQVVRVLSVVCVLIFVEELAIAETTQTVTGVVLIAVQSILTGILALLIIWNAMIVLFKQNPHRQRRKEIEKLSGSRDTLTPLDIRNSLLLDDRTKTLSDIEAMRAGVVTRDDDEDNKTAYHKRDESFDRYSGKTMYEPYSEVSPLPLPSTVLSRSMTPVGGGERQNLVGHAAPIDGSEAPLAPSGYRGFGHAYSQRIPSAAVLAYRT